MPVDVTYYTDPCSPWSWALEPVLRKLECRFGETLSMRYVMCGIAGRSATLSPLSKRYSQPGQAPAELWRIATEWRVKSERVGSGELGALA